MFPILVSFKDHFPTSHITQPNSFVKTDGLMQLRDVVAVFVFENFVVAALSNLYNCSYTENLLIETSPRYKLYIFKNYVTESS